jgi:hypothetical protein
VSGGAAISLSSEELFGTGARSIGKDATYIGERIDWLRKVVEKQEVEKDRLEKIDTGAGELMTPIPEY